MRPLTVEPISPEMSQASRREDWLMGSGAARPIKAKKQIGNRAPSLLAAVDWRSLHCQRTARGPSLINNMSARVQESRGFFLCSLETNLD